MMNFFNVFLPLVLVAVLATFNVLNGEYVTPPGPDLEISTAIALTTVILLPALDQESKSNDFGADQVWICTTFLGLILTSVNVSGLSELERNWVGGTGIFLLWICLVFPLYNMWNWTRLHKNIRGSAFVPAILKAKDTADQQVRLRADEVPDGSRGREEDSSSPRKEHSSGPKHFAHQISNSAKSFFNAESDDPESRHRLACLPPKIKRRWRKPPVVNYFPTNEGLNIPRLMDLVEPFVVDGKKVSCVPVPHPSTTS